MSDNAIRLTAYTACAGCAAKMAPGDLREMLVVLESRGASAHANLLVGLERPDDAAVYRIAHDFAIVGDGRLLPARRR